MDKCKGCNSNNFINISADKAMYNFNEFKYIVNDCSSLGLSNNDKFNLVLCCSCGMPQNIDLKIIQNKLKEIKEINVIDNSVIYILFSAYGDGESFTAFNLVEVFKTVAAASEYIAIDKTCINHVSVDLVHNSMNKFNNYTFIGERESCNHHCSYGNFGGYIIEKRKIL